MAAKKKKAPKKKPDGTSFGPKIGDAGYHRLLIAKKKKLEALRFLQGYQRKNKLEYFNSGRELVDGTLLRANPKQQMIINAWNDPIYKTFVYVGGNRCLGGETPVFNPVTGESKPISEIDSDFHVLAWNGTELVPAFAFKPFAKEAEPLYRVTLETGQSFVAAGGHRVLTSVGFRAISELQGECVLVPPVSSPESYQSARVLFVSATVTYERTDVKWTTHVPVYNNYWAGGCIHANSGKTTLGVIISLSVLFGEWLWNNQPILFPHKMARKVRLVSQDWEAGVIKTVVPEIKKWWPSELRPYKSRRNTVGAEAYWTDTISGSTLEIMTGNQDPMLHEGGHHDLIWADEPISRAHYIANARGLVDRQGRELFTMTLLEEPWIDREIIKKTLKDPHTGKDTGRPDPSVFVVETEMTDNVGFGLTEQGVAEFSAKLTDEEKDVRIKGIPRYKKGLVYPTFRRDTHLKPRFRVPLDWPVDIAIDTHPRKPHSVLFLATNPRGLKYCCAEIRMHGNGKQVADEIVRLVQWGVYRVNRVIIDPLSKGDSNDTAAGSTYDQIAETLARFDMYVEVASKNKDAGILMVKEHLMSENGEASLFFMEDLVYTIREIENLMWEKPADEDREKVQKTEDDMCENLYRLILLETEYVPPIEEDETDNHGRDSVNETTGY